MRPCQRIRWIALSRRDACDLIAMGTARSTFALRGIAWFNQVMDSILRGHEGLKLALGRIPSGLFAAGAILDGRRVGILCSFVEQAGFEPPMISVALGVDRPLRAAVERGGMFSLNVLGAEDKKLLAAFASGREGDPFAAFTLVENAHGLPQLADALAWLACRPCGSVAAGDHVVYVAEVIEGCLHRAAGEPMIRLRKNGLTY
jgi:flavin reductase (DIM6/NTAB) family NADH-FMN oxidoreductase RutF